MRLYLRAAATICFGSNTLCEQGFSTYTSLPAWQAQMVCSVCQWFGVAIEIASIVLSSRNLRTSAHVGTGFFLLLDELPL